MNRFIITSFFITFLVVCSLITAKTSDAGIGPSFTIGPNGDAFKLVDCSIDANNINPDLCFDTIGGVISWPSSRTKAQAMTYKGYPCDLAIPSTEEVNDFLKDLPGFEAACTMGCNGFQLCPWFGGQKIPPSTGQNGPFFFVNNLNAEIPCPFNMDDGPACNPIVDPVIDTPLTFQDWCRDTEQSPNCPGDEPNNNPNEDFMGYVMISGVVGWHDCTNTCNLGSGCQPTSYIVQCDLPTIVRTPVPTLSEWGLITMAGILGIVGFMVMRRRKQTA